MINEMPYQSINQSINSSFEKTPISALFGTACSKRLYANVSDSQPLSSHETTTIINFHLINVDNGLT